MKTLILAAIRCPLMFTAAAAFSLALPAKANLITNPGFETGDFTGWTDVSGSVFGTFIGVPPHSVPPHSGSFQAVYGGPGSLSQSVATTAGASYTIDFFLALAGFTAEHTFSVSWGGVPLLTLGPFHTPFGYTEYTFNATAATASTALLFQFNGIPLTQFWLLDDVSVNPAGVGVPDGGSTVSLLGCALLGLAALRRKLSC